MTYDIYAAAKERADTEADMGPAEADQDSVDSDSTGWSHANTLLLIDTYRKYRVMLQDPRKKKKEIWDLIAKSMNEVQKKHKFTGAKCNKKWNNLELRYKGKRDKSKKTGRGAGKKWPYFELMDGLIGTSAASTSVTESCEPAAETSLISPESASDDDCDSTPPESLSMASRKRRRDQAPKWFHEYAQKVDEDNKQKHEELKDMLQRQENAIRERTAVMTEMKDIFKSWVKKQLDKQQ